MKALLALLCATAFVVTVSQAQTNSTTTTTSAGGTTESTTITTEAAGTITEYTPGSSIVLNTGTGEPVHYRFGKTVTYVTPSGKMIESSRIKTNSKVHVHYLREGGDMVVDKVIVNDVD
jgi:diphthamide biosynthesis methyltransferase